MIRRIEVVDIALREMFTRALREHSASPPVLCGVTLERDRRDKIAVRAEWQLGPDRNAPRIIYVQRVPFPEHLSAEWRRARRATSGRVRYNADMLWSEMLENHRLEHELFSIRNALETAERIRAPADQIATLRDAYLNRRDTYLRNHHAQRRPAYDHANMYAMPYGYTYELAEHDMRVDSQTATEVRQRMQRELAAYEQRWLGEQAQQQANENAWRQATVNQRYIFQRQYMQIWPRYDDENVQAQDRALQLLKENLTPAQFAQYEKDKHFDVKGGTTGKTYRINHGRQMNLVELDKSGTPVCGWCFLPAGGLVEGDVMLAQKNALELFETDALRVANRFAVNGSESNWNDAMWQMLELMTEVEERRRRRAPDRSPSPEELAEQDRRRYQAEALRLMAMHPMRNGPIISWDPTS